VPLAVGRFVAHHRAVPHPLALRHCPQVLFSRFT
jgi:hypothetical protein